MSAIFNVRPLAVFLSTLFAMFMTLASTTFAQDGPPPGTPPLFTAAYSPTGIGPGGTSSLTYTIDNTANAVPVIDLDFTHILPVNVTLATPSSAATSCSGGTLTAASGGGSVAFTDGELGSGTSCTITVNVTSSTVGAYTNSTGDLTSIAGNSGSAATNTLTVATTAPGFFQSFSPSGVTSGGVSTLTYTIDNTANAGVLGFFSFTNTLPSGVIIASPSNATTSCIAGSATNTFTATAGTTAISFQRSGFAFPGFEALAAGANCTVSVDVTSTTVGTHTNTSGALNYDGNSAGTSTAALTVTGVDAGKPLISKSFTNDPVNPGGTVTLDYTITNTDRSFAATDLAFTEDLTATLAGVTFVSLLSNDCGGTVGGGSTTSINFSGGTLSAGGSCTISVSLKLSPTAAGGTHASTSGAVSATVNGTPNVVGNMATDNLNVQLGGGAPTVTLSLTSGNPGGTTVATYTVTNTSTASSLTDLAFITDFPADTIATASVTPGNGLCGVGSIGTFAPRFDGDPTIPARLSVSAGTLAPAGSAGDSCTFMITLDILAAASTGPHTVTTSAPTSTVGGASVTSSAASGDLTVGAGGGNLAVDLTKAFSVASSLPNQVVGLTFTITNRAESTGTATDISFTDPLSAATFVPGTTLTSITSNDCGATVTGIGTGTITVTGGSRDIGESCTIGTTITLGGGTTGDRTNQTSGVSAGLDGGTVGIVGAPASANLSVTEFFPLTFTQSFIGDPVLAGDTVTLEYTIDNPNRTEDATVTFFTHSFAAVIPGLIISGVLPTTPCGAGSSVSGTTLLVYIGGIIPAGDSCTFAVTLQVPAGAANNSYGSITSNLNATIGGIASVTAAASDTLVVNSASLLFSKSFTSSPVFAGSPATLEFTLQNTNEGTAVSDIEFTDDLGAMNFKNAAGTTLTGTTFDSVAFNDCGATVSGTTSDTITVGAGSLAAGATCNIRVSLTPPAATASGSYTNTASTASGLIGVLPVTGDAASANLQVFAMGSPTFSKSFAGPVQPNGTTQLTFTIANPGAAALSNLDFSDDLNSVLAGLTATSLPANPCGAGSSITGPSFLAFTGGTVAAGGSCTFDVGVTAPAGAGAGSYGNTTSDLRSSGLKLADPASASLTVEPAPTFAKAFGPTSVAQGALSTLTFTIDNTASSLAASSLAFTDTLPAGLVVATTPSASTTCTGGTVTAAAGSGAISYTGGTVGASASCTVVANVTAEATNVYNNTSGDLTSNAGNSGTAAASLTVTAAPLPTFVKAFGGSIVQGDTTTLAFTITNTALVDATALAFTDNMPTAVTVAANPGVINTCTGGTVTAAAGTSLISYTGGTVGASGNCIITVNVTSDVAGPHSNVSGALASSLGTSSTANASITVTNAPIPTFSKAFTAGTIAQGEIDTLTFTINNSGALIEASSLSFSDTFPTGMVIAPTPNNSSTCTGGMGSFTPGAGTMSYAGGTVAASAICTVSFDVTSATVGTLVNTSSPLSTSLGEGSTSTANLIVTAATAPAFSKAFNPSSIVQGTTSTLIFTINNGTTLIDATALAFSDTFPAGMTVAATPNASTTCTGGTITAAAGAGLASYSGGTVDASASCTVSVDVTSATLGASDNTSGDLTSSQGSSGTANAQLTVTDAATPTFSKAFTAGTIVQGDVDTLTFTIDNSAALIDASALAFSDTFPAGMTVAATPNASTTCTGGTITATAGAGIASYSGGTVAASASCTVSVDVTSATTGASVNISDALSSSLGASGTSTATLMVTSTTAPTFSKAFTAGTIIQGDVDTLTFTIDNSAALIDASALAFSDTFPAGMTVAATPNASTTCTGGTITATAGAGIASYSGGTVAASASCTVSVDVTSATTGASVNISDALSSSLGASGTSTATLTVTAATAPIFSKTFNPSSIVQGDTSTLTFTIDNSSVATDATSLDFSDTFPAGMAVASTPNTSTTCTGGVITASSGSGSVTFTDGTVTSSSSCTVSVDVTSATVGDATNSSGDLTSSLGNSGTATATLAVTAAPAPNFAMAFAPSTIVQDSTSTLTFTVDNSAALVDATGLAFNNVFPAGMTIATTPNVGSTCGGVATANAGDNAIGFSGGSSAASGSCTIAVDITSNAIGALANSSNALSSSLGTSAAASATLTVTANPIAQVTIIQITDTDSTFGFSSAESLLNFNISTVSGSGTQGPISLTAGTYVISQARPEGFGNASLSCSDANSIGVSGTGELTLNLEARESVTCTYTSVDSVTPTRQAINDFLNRRITQILSSEPSNGRRIGRLKGKFGGTRIVSFTKGDLGSLMPVNFDLKTLGSGNYNISGSLSQAAAAIVRHPLSLDGATDGDVTINNSRFDVWFEASYNRFNGSQGSNGHFGIAYLGADYLYSKDLLIGFLVQFDDLEDRSVTLNKTVDGTGWMAGPYMTARIAPNLYFDGRFAIGRSSNFLDLDLNNTSGLGSGNFDTSRWLVDASLVGDIDLGKWQMQPNLSVSYMEESQKAFVDSLSVSQPGQTVSQGQVRIGPNFSTRIENDNGTIFEPSFTFDGIFSFGNSDGTLTPSVADETDGLRGRIEAGVTISTRKNVRVELGFNYDGIGKSDYESYGARLAFSMPF